MKTALCVEGLSHAYAMRPVLENIDLAVPAGRTLALVGPSGCGKTTLLHLCAGLLEVQQGRIEQASVHRAMLFQQPHLLPWKSAADNIALGLKAQGIPRSHRLEAACAMGLRVGLDVLALAQFPHELSGGMQSRVSLARALVLQPDLLLLDEPFAALDVGLRAQMHQLLLGEQHQRQMAVLMITHDLMEAVRLADTVLVMASRPGRLVWQLELNQPARQRSDAWVYQTSADLLSQPVVRLAFDLPAIEANACNAEGPTNPEHALAVGTALRSTGGRKGVMQC